MGKVLEDALAARPTDQLFSISEAGSACASPSAAVAVDPVKAEAESSSLYGWEGVQDINEIFSDLGISRGRDPLRAPIAAGKCSADVPSPDVLIKSEPLTETDIRVDSPTVTGTVSSPDPNAKADDVPLDMETLRKGS